MEIKASSNSMDFSLTSELDLVDSNLSDSSFDHTVTLSLSSETQQNKTDLSDSLEKNTLPILTNSSVKAETPVFSSLFLKNCQAAINEVSSILQKKNLTTTCEIEKTITKSMFF